MVWGYFLGPLCTNWALFKHLPEYCLSLIHSGMLLLHVTHRHVTVNHYLWLCFKSHLIYKIKWITSQNRYELQELFLNSSVYFCVPPIKIACSFGTTREHAYNSDTVFIFGWTISSNEAKKKKSRTCNWSASWLGSIPSKPPCSMAANYIVLAKHLLLLFFFSFLRWMLFAVSQRKGPH